MDSIKVKVKSFFDISEEKRRFLLFAFVLFAALFTAFYLLRIAYARYETNAKLKADVMKALYIFEAEKLQFNLESEGIIPSANPYTYKFSVIIDFIKFLILIICYLLIMLLIIFK